MLHNFSSFLLSSADFFKKNKNILSGTLSECQMVWIQIRTNILSVLIWVQTVCKDYQHTTKVSFSLVRKNVNSFHTFVAVPFLRHGIVTLSDAVICGGYL